MEDLIIISTIINSILLLTLGIYYIRKARKLKRKVMKPSVNYLALYGKFLMGSELITPETIGFNDKVWGSDVNFKVIKEV